MINVKVEGSFIAQVFRGGIEISKTKEIKNLILSNAMSSAAQAGNFLQVGTGSTAPAYGDVSLVNSVAAINGSGWSEVSSILTGTDYKKESRNIFTFAQGSIAANLTELGVADSLTLGGSLDTRALFKDGIGDPTTIVVTAQDQLVVTYFLKKTIVMTTTVGVVSADVGGVPTDINYTIRPCISNDADGGIPAHIPSSIFGDGVDIITNDANRISVAPVTFVPSLIDSGGNSANGTSVFVLTATGNEVTHTFTYPIGSGNYQWVSATLGQNISTSVDVIFFQIEFDGPNYITKVGTETITFKIKEIVAQVL